MTIAKRMLILLAVPLLVLVGLGIFVRMQLARIEVHSRFMAESQIVSLAVLGNISRSFTELRVNVRSYLLSTDKADVTRLLRQYSGSLVTDDRDRRLLNEDRTLSREWIAGSEKIISLAGAGRREDARLLMLSGPIADLGGSLSKVSSEWIQHNEWTEVVEVGLVAIAG